MFKFVQQPNGTVSIQTVNYGIYDTLLSEFMGMLHCSMDVLGEYQANLRIINQPDRFVSLSFDYSSKKTGNLEDNLSLTVMHSTDGTSNVMCERGPKSITARRTNCADLLKQLNNSFQEVLKNHAKFRVPIDREKYTRELLEQFINLTRVIFRLERVSDSFLPNLVDILKLEAQKLELCFNMQAENGNASAAASESAPAHAAPAVKK